MMRWLRSLGRSLTLRGRGLLAVGLGLGAGATLSGQRDLLRVAILLVALPILAFIAMHRRSLSLGIRREVESMRIPVGETGRVDLTLQNLSAHRCRPLLLQDTVPAELGHPARLVMAGVEAGGTRHGAYPLRAERRGRFEIGPLHVSVLDPFGLVRVTHSFTGREPVLVVPPTVPLADGLLGAEHRGRGDMAAASLAARGSEDLVPREYRVGDDLRRIHWRATARADELMVRREEQPLTRQATVLVDLREEVQWGEGPRATIELVLSVVASIGGRLLRDGWRVRVAGLDGMPLAPLLAGATGEAMLLDVLATVQPVPGTGVVAGAARSDCVVVVAAPDVHLGEVLGTEGGRGPGDLGVAIIVPGGRGRERETPTVGRLRGASWHVAEIATLAELPTAWATVLDPVRSGVRA